MTTTPMTGYQPSIPRGHRPPDRCRARLIGVVLTDDGPVEAVAWEGVVNVTNDGYQPVGSWTVAAGADDYKWQRLPG